jgi:hypothetical protein
MVISAILVQIGDGQLCESDLGLLTDERVRLRGW